MVNKLIIQLLRFSDPRKAENIFFKKLYYNSSYQFVELGSLLFRSMEQDYGYLWSKCLKLSLPVRQGR